jgi:hypothetical protein
MPDLFAEIDDIWKKMYCMTGNVRFNRGVIEASRSDNSNDKSDRSGNPGLGRLPSMGRIIVPVFAS